MEGDLPALSTTDLGGPVRYRAWDGDEDTTFVLVHGLGGSHLSWLRVAPELAGFGGVLALDLPGFGATPLGGRRAGLMDQRKVLSGFLSEKATGRVVVCGNSMGGGLAMLQAAIEPKSVAALVLSSSIFPVVKRSLPHPLVITAFGFYATPRAGEWFVAERARRLTPEQVVRASFRMIAADPGSIPEEDIRRHVDLVRERLNDPDAATAFLEGARSIVRLGKRPDVARRAMDAVHCPVLVLHGGRDRLVPVRYAESASAGRHSWRLRVFPDLGHVLQLEAPGRWLSEVADWHTGIHPR